LARDTLYLLAPGFEDQDGTWVCHDCTAMEGYLQQFPHLREHVEVVYLPFPRPRAAMVELLDDENQGLPRLIIGDDWNGSEVQRVGDRRFVGDSRPIMRYLAARYGSAPPHP
jgi:hypothetical protein